MKIGHDAVDKVLVNLASKDEIKSLILEFDERKTREALFAHYCDKLECDLQSKLYDEEKCVDINNQEGNISFNDPKVQELLKKGMSWSEMWLTFGQNNYNYDKNFKAVSDYALNNQINL